MHAVDNLHLKDKIVALNDHNLSAVSLADAPNEINKRNQIDQRNQRNQIDVLALFPFLHFSRSAFSRLLFETDQTDLSREIYDSNSEAYFTGTKQTR